MIDRETRWLNGFIRLASIRAVSDWVIGKLVHNFY